MENLNEGPLMDPKAQLEETIHYLIGHGNMFAPRRHLEQIIDLIPHYEKLGYQVIVEAENYDNGKVNIYLSKNEIGEKTIEVKFYEVDFDLGLFESGKFVDEYPKRGDIEKLFEVAAGKIEAIEENRDSNIPPLAQAA